MNTDHPKIKYQKGTHNHGFKREPGELKRAEKCIRQNRTNKACITMEGKPQLRYKLVFQDATSFFF